MKALGLLFKDVGPGTKIIEVYDPMTADECQEMAAGLSEVTGESWIYSGASVLLYDDSLNTKYEYQFVKAA